MIRKFCVFVQEKIIVTALDVILSENRFGELNPERLSAVREILTPPVSSITDKKIQKVHIRVPLADNRAGVLYSCKRLVFSGSLYT